MSAETVCFLEPDGPGELAALTFSISRVRSKERNAFDVAKESDFRQSRFVGVEIKFQRSSHDDTFQCSAHEEHGHL